MTDITKSFRDGQVQSQAVRDKEKAVAAKRQSVEELKALINAAQEENSRRRQALTNSTLSIQPLQAEVDAQWAQRNAFTTEQTARLEEMAKEEQLLTEKISLVNHRIVEVAGKIDAAKADAAHLLPQTAARIAALERQLEADTAALNRLSRLVRADDEAVGERIEDFEDATGGRYPVEIISDVAGVVGDRQLPPLVVNMHASNGPLQTRARAGFGFVATNENQNDRNRRSQQYANGRHGRMPISQAIGGEDIEQSMMLMDDEIGTY